jgi:hypothetical protein
MTVTCCPLLYRWNWGLPELSKDPRGIANAEVDFFTHRRVIGKSGLSERWVLSEEVIAHGFKGQALDLVILEA